MPRLLILLALAMVGACMAPEVKFPPGAKLHGPYLDPSFEGYMVRAAFVQDITVIVVQQEDRAPEPTDEDFAEARLLLGTGEMDGAATLPGLSDAAKAFEDVAIEVQFVPGWCRFETRFSYLPPVPTPLAYDFRIRGTYHEGIGAFVFAGQCTPT